MTAPQGAPAVLSFSNMGKEKAKNTTVTLQCLMKTLSNIYL